MAASLDWDFRGARRVSRALNTLARRGADYSRVLEDIGSYLETSTRLRFEAQAGPGGQRWKPTWRGGQILTLSARLLGSITYQVEGKDSVRVGSNVIYAGVHQFGATIKAKAAAFLQFRTAAGWVRARQVEIPARPFLGVDSDDEAEIGRIVTDWLAEPFKGAAIA